MPKYRQLHTKIIDSFDFNEMPDDFTRLFWILLLVVADSEGRAIDNTSWIRSRMFPLRGDVDLDQIEEAINWLDNRKLITRYQVCERRYFQICNFKKYQRGTEKEAASMFPPPPDKDNFTQELVKTNSRVSQEEVGVAESVSASEYESVSEFEYESGGENIYRVYEKEVGALTPMLAEMLDEIEKTYPADWFPMAVKEAKASSTRINLKYIEAILKRWKAEGRQELPKKNGHKKVKYEEVMVDGERFMKAVEDES